MKALTHIYSHRVPGFKETQIGFDPKQKRNPNPKRKAKTRMSVDRGPCPWSTGRSTGPLPRAACFQSVDRAVDRSMPRSTGQSLCTSCTPVDRAADWPSPPVDRAVDRELILACSMSRLAHLSSDLCATFFHLLYLLSPYNSPPR